MKVEIITTFFKETFLAPLFLAHYETWADVVTILTERMSAGLDDAYKCHLLNNAILHSKADWCIIADFDEFIFPKGGLEPRAALEAENGHVCQCEMLRVWRHVSDQDIDRMALPKLQRRHGGHDHVKPCIIRPGPGIRLDIGTHGINVPAHYVWGKPWTAVHWANADPEFGIERTLLHRQTRLSQNNLDHGWGIKPEWLDPNYLKELYAKHLNDPELEELKPVAKPPV